MNQTFLSATSEHEDPDKMEQHPFISSHLLKVGMVCKIFFFLIQTDLFLTCSIIGTNIRCELEKRKLVFHVNEFLYEHKGNIMMRVKILVKNPFYVCIKNYRKKWFLDYSESLVN